MVFGLFSRRAAALALLGAGQRAYGTTLLARAAAAGAAGAAVSMMSTASESKEAPAPMPMRVLGNTGLQISVLSFGFWATFGAKPDLADEEGIKRATDCMRVARAAGVNCFDNAETYGNPQGEAERMMGEALRRLQREDPKLWRRSELIITTKIFWCGTGVNEKGLSRKHINEGMDASLKRLGLEYVDLVFCHRPDPHTPTETVVRAMSDLVRSGKATAWGTSEWSAQQLTEAVWYANANGLEPPQFEQPQYNMFHRERVEKEYYPMYKPPYNLGLTIWSPLAGGLLTGKYNEGVPAGSRLTAPGYTGFKSKLDKWHTEGKIESVRSLDRMARDELGCTMAELAIAWVIKNENVTTALLGATTTEQLRETLGAVAVARRLTAEQMARIDDILGSKPEAYLGYGCRAGPLRRKIDGL